MVTHVKFVSIPTRDQDRALRFWTEVIGFRVLTDQPFDQTQRWIELRAGASETRVVLFTFGKDGPQPGDRFPGAFAADSVEATYKDLSAKGVEFLGPPQKQPWGTFAVFKDPDGNQFVLSSR